jgi:FkbM family methyltransferase
MIKRAVQSTLKMFGFRLTRVRSIAQPTVALPAVAPPAWALKSLFPVLKGFGFDPKHILDIGANTGLWTREAINYFPRAHYTLVEPQDELKVHIQDLVDRGYQVHWVNAGASDEPGILPLHVQGRNDSSTFRQVSTCLRQIPVRVQTVNEIAASTGLPAPEMVKIDAEGFDLKVLAGASELFGKTEIFLAEASIVAPHFDNTAAALIQTMADAGYRLIDITDINRSPRYGVLWLCEFAFLLKTSHLLDMATCYSEDLAI